MWKIPRQFTGRLAATLQVKNVCVLSACLSVGWSVHLSTLTMDIVLCKEEVESENPALYTGRAIKILRQANLAMKSLL